MRISDWSSDVCSSDLKSGQPPPGFLHIGKLTLCARAGLLFWSVVATKATTCLRHASCALVRHRLPGNVLKDLWLTFRQKASCARQAPHKRTGVLPAASHSLHLGIALIHQRRYGQCRAIGARLIKRQAQVLAHPVDGEAEIEAVLRHRFPTIVDRKSTRLNSSH